jgi:hypothetical protein
MKKSIIAVLAVASVLFTSCAKFPQPELDAAKAAVESVKAVEGNRYVADEFNALQDELNASVTAAETEKSKFFISRDYKPVVEKLNGVIASSEALKTKTEERKAQVRTEVQEAVTAVTTLIAENKELVKKAPKGKEGKAALEAIQNDITVIEASLNEVNTLVTNGDYLTAKDKVNASKTKAESIKAELEAAIAKTKKRK